MKTPIPFILLSLFFSFCSAQNLVPNPSFEEYDTCPYNVNDIGLVCHDWSSFSVTADYYNSCSPSVGNSFNNNFGFQLPRTGYAYAGFLNYSPIEQLGAELLNPLETGVRYYVCFYVSCAYRFQGTNIATNKMGAMFTTYQYYAPNSNGLLPNNCQIYTDQIVTDTLNWTKISGSFVADSAYRYIVIGRFFDNMHVDTLHLPHNLSIVHSYYYLDDVCVSRDSSTCSANTSDCTFALPTAFTPNGDNLNDKYKVATNCSRLDEFTMRIYNRWGELVFTTNDYTLGWDGKYNGIEQPAGVYIVYAFMVSNEEPISKSTSISLFR